jgi:predicted transcriptional regulator
MAISLSPETQKLIEERMKETGVGTADELVRVALQTLRQERGEDFDDLDEKTKAAIEEGLAQADRGEGRPWEDVRKEIRARFIDRGK